MSLEEKILDAVPLRQFSLTELYWTISKRSQLLNIFEKCDRSISIFLCFLNWD
nr:hypothetical protein [Gloeotrichia echinulata DEX184]